MFRFEIKDRMLWGFLAKLDKLMKVITCYMQRANKNDGNYPDTFHFWQTAWILTKRDIAHKRHFSNDKICHLLYSKRIGDVMYVRGTWILSTDTPRILQYSAIVRHNINYLCDSLAILHSNNSVSKLKKPLLREGETKRQRKISKYKYKVLLKYNSAPIHLLGHITISYVKQRRVG